MNWKCLIVDDEYPALALLEDYVSKVPALQLAGKCENATDALAALQEQDIDILFLDIQMPDLTGVELLRSLRSSPQVVFTTAYANYALEGFALDVTDYLLKPFSFERFLKAVNKSIDQLKLKKAAQGATGATQEPPKDHFFVRADHKTMKVNMVDILYIEGLREYVSIFTKDKRIITLEAMKNMEQILPADQFMRVHKSYIVALEKVDALSGNMLELKGKQIPIGRMYREKVEAFFGR